MKPAFLLLSILITCNVFAQRTIHGVIADSASREPLSFATVHSAEHKRSSVSGLEGRFILTVPVNEGKLVVSFIGYLSRMIEVQNFQDGDTIFLEEASTELGEVIIGPQPDRIKRIVNKAIENKDKHNPEGYNFYTCNIYYKVKADMTGAADSARLAKQSSAKKSKRKSEKEQKREAQLDSMRAQFKGNKHMLMAETYSKRYYKRPQQLSETILASRFSGLKNTYFANVVTDLLPFHIYTEYIELNGKDYVNPVAKGWQQRYKFRIEDELQSGDDTIYVLSFAPKEGKSFDALKGAVYINTNGFAISHIIASNADTSTGRNVKFEQIYAFVNGRWFPQQLNYDLQIPINPMVRMKMNGRSFIDSVSFDELPGHHFNKAYPVKFHDSIDKRSASDWARFRNDTISTREMNTYRFMDSLSTANHLETLVLAASKLAYGELPAGKLTIDLTRIVARNNYENWRFGLGLYTSEKVSKYYSVGGWFGYGLDDKRFKYGGSLTLYRKANKDKYVTFSHQDTYRTPGEVRLHPMLDRTGLRNWLLTEVDRFIESFVRASIRSGYLEIRPEIRRAEIKPITSNTFTVDAKGFSSFKNYEAGIGFRYAYGERRIPVFDYYTAADTKYPVFHLKLNAGNITYENYGSEYLRLLGAVTFRRHNNRWGYDLFRLEGGMIKTMDNDPLPRSFLLAGNGFNVEGTNYYAWGGFITMGPFEFYSDRYASVFYRHDFDMFLWRNKYSKPYLSIGHNMIYGGVKPKTLAANPGMGVFTEGYHESGLIVNQLLRVNLHFSDVFFNAGGFYHWDKSGTWKDIKPVIGISFGF